MKPLRILFLGNLWLGSDARTMRDSLCRRFEILVDDVDLDRYVPRTFRIGDIITRKILRFCRNTPLYAAIQKRLDFFKPDILIVYKGAGIDPEIIRQARSKGILCFCYFPDPHPWIYGEKISHSLGLYDTVFSAKSFHPEIWKSQYLYDNTCIHISHGYDPYLHYRKTFCFKKDYEIALIANHRDEYQEIIEYLLCNNNIRRSKVLIGGRGWSKILGKSLYSKLNITYTGGIVGQGYTEALRSTEIVIAPVMRNVIVNGEKCQGDMVTARTFQFAAAHCFFVHQRTEEVKSLYCEESEVPMWSSIDELTDKLQEFKGNLMRQRYFAERANRRATGRYSIDESVEKMLQYVYKKF